MRGYLLDSHIALWWLESPERVDPKAAEVIRSRAVPVWLSTASLWEMAIKKSLGQLNYPSTLLDALAANAVEILDVRAHHALAVASLPMLHRDPFDRLLVAQARSEDLTILTRDKQIEAYDVPCMRG